jgi:hypothetical protein
MREGSVSGFTPHSRQNPVVRTFMDLESQEAPPATSAEVKHLCAMIGRVREN